MIFVTVVVEPLSTHTFPVHELNNRVMTTGRIETY